MKIRATIVLLLLTNMVFGQIAETIRSEDFEKKGPQLLINFDIPYETMKLTYNVNSIIITANGERIEAKSLEGDLENLKTGETYAIAWNVLDDVFELANPTRAEINLEYTKQAREIVEKLQEQERRAKEQQQKKQEARRRKQQRRENKPFTMGILGYVGGTYGTFEGVDEDLTPEIGFGYGLGVEMEFRLGPGTYLQVEGGYSRQDLAYSHRGDDSEYNFIDAYFYDIERAKIHVEDYRGYLRLKISDFLQVGGYVAFAQSMMREGELEYEVIYADGTFNTFQDTDFQLDLLGGSSVFPSDNDGTTPGRQMDYGVTFGIETPTKSSLIIGLGYDLSLQSIINPDYDGFTNNSLIDIYPSQDADIIKSFGYLRLGLRF